MVKSLLRHTAAALALLLSTTTAAASIQDSYTIYEIDDEEEGSTNKPQQIDIITPILCSQELNLYCPPSTTCCPKHAIKSNDASDSSINTEKEIVGYSCLVSWSSAVPQGPCCDHQEDINSDDVSEFGSGCAAGYTCAAPLDDTLKTSNEQQTTNPLTNAPHCKRDDNTSHQVDKRGRPINTEYQYMPRYITCPAFNINEGNDIGKPYGLPIPLKSASYDKSSAKVGGVSSSDDLKLNNKERMKANTVADDTNDDSYIGQLAYFTNMGPLLTTNSDDELPYSQQHGESITTAVIGIHGSGRDAGSYLCALIAAVGESGISGSSTTTLEEELLKSMEGVSTTQRDRRRRAQSSDKKEERTLVIAPWFLAPSDGQPQSSTSTTSTTSSLPFLQWADRALVSHTFRYGAESISVPPPAAEDVSSSSTTTISSYGAMDVLLETLFNKKNYPNLKRIVVAGHSAGGQFVHRWGLSSDSWCFGDRHGQPEDADGLASLPSIRVVAANPRSYAYLDKRRYFPTTDESTVTLSEQTEEEDKDTLSPFNKLDFRLPTTSEFNDCQEYNQYCWGLQDNPNVPAPYITNNVKNDNTSLFCRYASRDVVYLSGQRDTKQLGNQICDEDGYQGPSRRERSERFYASLQVQGGEVLSSCQGSSGTPPPDKVQVHDRIVVQDVGHDHALIFQSKEGKEGMFSSSDPALN